MSIESTFFKKYIPKFDKIIEYGFTNKNDFFIYEKLFMNKKFRAAIKISKIGEVSGIVYDTENEEEYLPFRIKNQEGSFIGDIRNAYEKILLDIRNNCFVEKYFLTQQANRITDLIIKKYNDNPLFMWKSAPTCGVFKNPNNNKWYGIIMNIDFSKLDKNRKGEIEIINLKLDKNKILELLKKDSYYPAWHMNKKYWITIVLNDTLPDSEIMEHIDESYRYTISKNTGKKL